MIALAALAELSSMSATGQITAVEPSRIRIATYNINWGNPNLDAVVATIRDSKADIVCLQETSQRAETFLRHRLATEYPHMRFVGHDNRFGAALPRERSRGVAHVGLPVFIDFGLGGASHTG